MVEIIKNIIKRYWLFISISVSAALIISVLSIWYVRHIRLERLEQQNRIAKLEQALLDVQRRALSDAQSAEEIARMQQELEALKKQQTDKQIIKFPDAPADQPDASKTPKLPELASVGNDDESSVEKDQIEPNDDQDTKKLESMFDDIIADAAARHEEAMSGVNDHSKDINDHAADSDAIEKVSADAEKNPQTESVQQGGYAAAPRESDARRNRRDNQQRLDDVLRDGQQRYLEEQARQTVERSTQAISDAVRDGLRGAGI